MRLITAALLVLSIAGCASAPLDIREQAARLGLEARVENTGALPVQTLQPPQVDGPLLRVYLEGDGRAWITPRAPSDDPTPTQSLVLDLLAADATPAAYLARPCQFVRGSGCRTWLWTDGRYSEPVVEATNRALDALKARLGIEHFELVGHSGGATIALLLAQRRADVVAVQTLAGNLAPSEWTRLKALSPLRGSLDPSTEPGRLVELPQRHLLGAADRVIPAAVTDVYLQRVAPRCAERLVVAGADHQHGYAAAWQQLSRQPLPCTLRSRH